jgi:hypothetical protein
MVLLLLAAAGCKPAVGSACKPDETRCLGKTAQLSCHAGKFIETPCKGPAGCSTSEAGVRCDISGNQAGDRCSDADEGAASCAGRRMIVCRGGRYVFAECRGPRGCANEGGRAVCDASLAQTGDACSKEGLKACSEDGTQVLTCQASKMRFFYFCRGKAGCAATSGKLNCDMSLAALKDPCDGSMEGKHACSEEGGSILVCRAGQFVLDERCPARKSCSTEGGGIRCERQPAMRTQTFPK